VRRDNRGKHNGSSQLAPSLLLVPICKHHERHLGAGTPTLPAPSTTTATPPKSVYEPPGAPPGAPGAPPGAPGAPPGAPGATHLYRSTRHSYNATRAHGSRGGPPGAATFLCRSARNSSDGTTRTNETCDSAFSPPVPSRGHVVTLYFVQNKKHLLVRGGMEPLEDEVGKEGTSVLTKGHCTDGLCSVCVQRHCCWILPRSRSTCGGTSIGHRQGKTDTLPCSLLDQVRLQTQVSTNAKYKGLMDCLQTTLKEEGVSCCQLR
jgi:hypothetical protein